jgi:hypothetical protein
VLEDTSQNLPPTPQTMIRYSLKTQLLFIISLIIVALASGSSVYFWQQNKIKEIQSNLIQQKEEIDENNSPTNSPTIATDNRKELSVNGWREKFRLEFERGITCEDFFKSRFLAEPNTTVNYTSSKYSYSINFPYNFSWGDKENKVMPYEKDENSSSDTILFGRPYPSEACTYSRIKLEELAASNIDQTIEKIKIENEKLKKDPNNVDGIVTYQKLETFKYPVLKMETSNALFGSIPSYRVFLPQVTLEFSDPFSLDQSSITQILSSINTTD